MKKKLTALFVALTTAATLLSGCAESDKALYKAIQDSAAADGYTAKYTYSLDVEISEPVTAVPAEDYIENDFGGYFYSLSPEEYADRINSSLTALADFTKDFRITEVDEKNGENLHATLTLAKPDMSMSFDSWQQGQSAAVIKIPTYISPFSRATAGKSYFYIDAEKLMEASAAEAGEESTAAALDTEAVAALSENISEMLLDRLMYPLVRSTYQENDITYYDVVLDDKGLVGLSDNVFGILSDDQAANLFSMAMFLVDQEIDMDKYRSDYTDGITQAAAASSELFNALDETDIFRRGLTARYGVNADGLLVSSDVSITADIDLSNPAALAVNNSMFSIYFSDVQPSGKYSITLHLSSEYDYNVPQIAVPAVTSENSVDLSAEYIEYMEVKKRIQENSEAWGWYLNASDYFIPGEASPITVTNMENGRSALMTPKIFEDDDAIGLPLADLCSLLDGVTCEWNPVLMSVEVTFPGRWGEEKFLYPNANGMAIVEEYWDNLSYDEDYNNVYTGSALPDEIVQALQQYNPYYVGCAIFDENGKSYVELGEFMINHDYICRLDRDGLYFMDYDKWWDDVHEGIEDNLFYNIMY